MHPNIYQIYDLLGHVEGPMWRAKMQGLHDTGQQQDIQGESQ